MWTGKTAINTSHSQTLKGRVKGKNNVKSATINWKSIMRWTLERRNWSVGLKSMHEASRQPREQESNLQLIEEQTHKISEQEQTISELSSQVSMLKSEVQKLADKNVKLNEADNVLKQNEELKKQNEKLKQDKLNAEQEAMTEVSAVKEECAKRERIAESKAQEADRLKSHLKAVEADLSGQIDKKAQNLVESKLNALHGVYEAKQRSLDRKFKAKTASYDSCMLGLLLYGVLITVFTAVRSEAFVSDFKTFFKVVWGFLLTCFGWLENGANFMAQIGDKIPQEIVATIVHWLLWFIVLFGVGIGAVVLLLIGIAKLVKWYAEEYADNTSLGFALVSLALSIFFAEEIRAFLPINLLLLLILVHIVYVLIRWYVKGCKRSRGYY